MNCELRKMIKEMAVAYFKKLYNYLHVENGEKHKTLIMTPRLLVKTKPPSSQTQGKRIWFLLLETQE
jgi:hypothetical protein